MNKITKENGNLLVPDKVVIPFIEGDGVGAEITPVCQRIVNEAVGRAYGGRRAIEWKEVLAGEKAFKQTGSWLPDETMEAFREYMIGIKGPLTTPIGGGIRSLNVALRQTLDLYVCLRPVRWFRGVVTPVKEPEKVDMYIFRENTEGLYVGKEEQIDENTVHAIKIVTKKASERIIRDAFEYAKKNGRKKVTCVHKANILKMSDGMFLAIFREVAKDYPEIEADDKIIDNTCMQLVMNPNQFDVMVMQNLYGDILSDLCSGLIGGLGLVPSSNIGADYAMFEAVHGSAPDIAGKHLANPTAFLWSACMMLEYLGENETASRIRKAVDEVLAEGKHLTRDLHGEASTEEYVDAVIARL